MWQDRLRQIIDLLETSDVTEIEVSFWGRKFRVSKGTRPAENPGAGAVPESVLVPTVPSIREKGGEDSTLVPAEETSEVEVRSPMVGTFYGAPSPESEPFVAAGDHVTAGQTLCVIEAMKIMNEIESEMTGRIVKILMENAQPVEYGQLLFVIEPD